MTQDPAHEVGKGQLEQRTSYDDREQVAEVLRVAAGDGRLSLEELEERLERCFEARTYAELVPLVADLPGQALAVAGAPARTKGVVRVSRAGGHVRYEGTWEVPPRIELDVRGGNVLLDFTSALVQGPVTEVSVDMRGGNLRLVVPEAYVVDAQEAEVRGGSVVHRGGHRTPDSLAVHRVLVTGSLVGGNIVVRRSPAPRRQGRLRRLLGGGEH